MTAYEASELFLEYLNTYFQFMFGYVGILSAFLVMSYAAASKLNRILAILVVGLFCLVCFMHIIQINLLRNDLTGMYAYLLELKASYPEQLAWFGTNPSWMVDLLTLITNTVLFGGLAGCLAYFLSQRRTASSGGGA